jgi:uncharacterized RDD family membrane protein YckC
METLEKSGLSKRFISSLIDYSVIGCFYLVFSVQFGEHNTNGEYSVNGIMALIPLGFWFIYLIVIESSFSATFGHFLLGAKILRIDNSRISFVDSLKRHLIDPIDFFMFGIPAMICIKNTKESQRLGDLWAKTIVVNDKEK